MNLDQFIDKTDPRILSRGYDYFHQDAVENLYMTGTGTWHADVTGRSTYQATVQMEKDQVKNWDCSCTYDMGPVCKHVIAVILHIRESYLQRKKNSVNGSHVQKRNGEPLSNVQMKLDQYSHEELKEFLSKYLQKDESLKQEFINYFENKLE